MQQPLSAGWVQEAQRLLQGLHKQAKVAEWTTSTSEGKRSY